MIIRGVVFVIEGIYLNKDDQLIGSPSSSSISYNQLKMQRNKDSREDNLNSLNTDMNKDFGNILNKYTSSYKDEGSKHKDGENKDKDDISMNKSDELNEVGSSGASPETSIRFSDSCTITSKRSQTLTSWRVTL